MLPSTIYTTKTQQTKKKSEENEFFDIALTIHDIDASAALSLIPNESGLLPDDFREVLAYSQYNLSTLAPTL